MISTAIAVVALAATSCGGGGTPAPSGAPGGGGGAKRVIGVSLADQKSLFYIAEADGIKTAAKDAGVDIVLLSADNNSTQQVNQVNDLITQGVNAIIFTAQDATAASAGVRAANRAKIPVIAVDQKPEGGDAKLATYIATDSVKAADALCTWMFEQMGGKGEIGILQGVLGPLQSFSAAKGASRRWIEPRASRWWRSSQPTGMRPRATRRPRTCCRPIPVSKPFSVRVTPWASAPRKPPRMPIARSSPSESTVFRP